MGAPAAPATASVRAGSVGLYRPRRPRASPLYPPQWRTSGNRGVNNSPGHWRGGSGHRRPSLRRNLVVPRTSLHCSVLDGGR
jgi:hypothetical protein